MESQIIEYMKFRAPVDLIQGMSGFLKKIKALLEVKDLVADAIEKTEIVKKYESGGEDSLSQKAYALQYDINKYAVKLYNYSVNPTREVSSFGAADPGQMFDRNAVYGRNPYSLKILIQEFDKKLHKATDKYEDDLKNMENKYAEKLFELLNLFRTDLKEDHGEIIVTNGITARPNRHSQSGSGRVCYLKANQGFLTVPPHSLLLTLSRGHILFSYSPLPHQVLPAIPQYRNHTAVLHCRGGLCARSTAMLHISSPAIIKRMWMSTRENAYRKMK